MSKPIIAFDLDDVLVDSTSFWRLEINRRTGSDLQQEHFMVPGQYSGYYTRLWKEHKIDHLISIDDIDELLVSDQSSLQPMNGAKEVLAELYRKYMLVAVTARNADQEEETLRWLEAAYPGKFSKVRFGNSPDGLRQKSKGDIYLEMGAKWLVDDNPGHCNDALDKGVQTLLFGNYGWNKPEIVEREIVRVKDWAAIGEYFDGK